MSIFKDKTLMITGGTGSFGNAVLKRFLCTDIGEIRIFSRDEKKQDDMRHEYQAKYPDVAHKIKFYIGDVRDLNSCKSAMNGVDFVFHAAALKQVPSCEFFPCGAFKDGMMTFRGFDPENIKEKRLTEFYRDSEYIKAVRDELAKYYEGEVSEPCFGQYCREQCKWE